MENNILLHRISYHQEASYPLLQTHNLLSIGFSDLAEQTFVNNLLAKKKWEDRWKVLEKQFNVVWGYQPRTRHILWRFLEGLKKGDWVLVPSWGVFSLYEVVSDKPMPIGAITASNLKDWNGNDLYLKNGTLHRKEANGTENVIDLGFCWEVKPIETNISRYDYADSALTARMKVRPTNVWLNDIKESVVNALNAFRAKKPINLHTQITDSVAPTILDTLREQLTPDKFEMLVEWYFRRIGASDVIRPAKNETDKEGDADVVATFEPIKLIIHTQVKFHARDTKTDSWAIEQVKGYKESKGAIAMEDGYSVISWVISSADGYTDDCVKMAKEEKVQLIDGFAFAKMLIEVGITGLEKAL